MPGSESLRTLRLLSRSSGGLLSGSENVTVWHLSASFESPLNLSFFKPHLLTISCLQRRCLARSMATEAQANTSTANPAQASPAPWDTPVTVMTYKFPSMEPSRFVSYSQKQLQMPTRKDLLHRAIVYEGDMTRQGTASTKWRDDVHGSHRKLMPQKGSGRARVGDRQSPIRVGGGVAHGPHPRDFSTGLPAKIYDQAWRTALSYRYQRGQLIVVENNLSLNPESSSQLLQQILEQNGWDSKNGRSTFITAGWNETMAAQVERLHRHAIMRSIEDVDVKNLLQTERLIIEQKALDQILKEHSRDLKSLPAKARYH